MESDHHYKPYESSRTNLLFLKSAYRKNRTFIAGFSVRCIDHVCYIGI